MPTSRVSQEHYKISYTVVSMLFVGQMVRFLDVFSCEDSTVLGKDSIVRAGRSSSSAYRSASFSLRESAPGSTPSSASYVSSFLLVVDLALLSMRSFASWVSSSTHLFFIVDLRASNLLLLEIGQDHRPRSRPPSNRLRLPHPCLPFPCIPRHLCIRRLRPRSAGRHGQYVHRCTSRRSGQET